MAVSLYFLLLPTLACMCYVFTAANAVHTLPSSFLDRTIASNTYTDIKDAISLVELDEFLEVVLVGNFTHADVTALSVILEDTSAHSIIKPLKAHLYEKKIFRVSLAARILWSAVSKAILEDSAASLSNTLGTYHARLGTATTLFVIAVEEQRRWTVAPDISSCATVLNMRSPGAAWIFLDLTFSEDHLSVHSLNQLHFNGISDPYTYGLANDIKEISEVLMPFPASVITTPSVMKEFVFLEISLCSAYTRAEDCPGDSLVAEVLRSVRGLQGDNSDHILIKTQSVSFNIHDYPELIYALHAASHYSGSSRGDTVLDLERMLYYVTRCRAIQQAISRAVDIEGENRGYGEYMLVPIFNIHLPGQLQYKVRHNHNQHGGDSNIQSFAMPRWDGLDAATDYPASSESSEILAVVRLSSDLYTPPDINGASIANYGADLFTESNAIPCGDSKLVPKIWNGNVLFDELLSIAWGVQIPQLKGIIALTTDDTSQSLLATKSSLAHDFRRSRSVDRTVIISRLEKILFGLNRLALSYSKMAFSGIPTRVAGGQLGKDLKVLPKYYTDITELVNMEVQESDGLQVFFNLIDLVDKATVEFSHLNYGVVKAHLRSIELLLHKLEEIYEFSAIQSVGRKVVHLNWNNAVSTTYADELLASDVLNNSSGDNMPPLISTFQAVLFGCTAGLVIFFLVKLCRIFFISYGGNRPGVNDPFRRHANRGAQKRM